MKTLMTIMVLVGFCSDVLAAPVKVPPLKLCMGDGGALVSRKKCKGGETTVDAAAIAALSGGGFNPGACRIDSDTDSDNTWGFLKLDCAQGEFLFQHGIQTPDSSDFEVQEIRLRSYEGEPYAAGVEYVIYGSEAWTAQILIVCCPR